MRVVRSLAFAGIVAVLATLATAAAVGEEPVGEVLVLEDGNFDAITAQHDALLVEFYAPWCGHCKQLAPKYDEAAKMLAADDATKHLRIAKMDADAQKQVPGKYGVSGFPTLKLFRNGELAGDYEGDRTAEAIVAYVKQKAAAAVNKEMTDAAALKSLTKTATKPTLIAVCSNAAHVDYKYYKQVVSKLADTGLDIFHSFTPSVLEAFGFYSSGCSIQMFRPTEGGKKPSKAVFKGTIFKDKLREWITTNAIVAFAKYTPETQKLFAMTGKNLIRIVRAESNPVDVKALTELSKAHAADFLFAVSDSADYAGDLEAHCGDKNAKVCVLLHDTKKNRVFGLEGGAATAAAITQFIADFNEKKLKVKVKSEATPAPAKAGEVVVVVGTNFESVVMESDKDVLIEFYAPWCGHCKALAPKFDQLAKDLESEFDSLAIAKMDLTNNDIPAEYKNLFSVSGFPTLFFAPKGKKTSPVLFEGKREVEDFKTWLAAKRA